MRRVFTTEDALARGLTRAALKWGVRTGQWRRIRRGVYGEGPDDPTEFDIVLATVLASRGVANGTLAGVLHGLDGVVFDPRPIRRRGRASDRIVVVQGIQCADGLQTLVDLASIVDDAVWEQALESALRKRLTTIAEIEDCLPQLGRSRTPGTARIRRVLNLRPPGAAPTESLLETLMVQLARNVEGLPDLVRQYRVEDVNGLFVARVDLAEPGLGLFFELDGQHHKGQPVYDARRETAVVAATGWLCGRFTWTEVVYYPVSTTRRLAAITEQARRRPLPAP